MLTFVTKNMGETLQCHAIWHDVNLKQRVVVPIAFLYYCSTAFPAQHARERKRASRNVRSVENDGKDAWRKVITAADIYLSLIRLLFDVHKWIGPSQPRSCKPRCVRFNPRDRRQFHGSWQRDRHRTIGTISYAASPQQCEDWSREKHGKRRFSAIIAAGVSGSNAAAKVSEIGAERCAIREYKMPNGRDREGETKTELRHGRRITARAYMRIINYRGATMERGIPLISAWRRRAASRAHGTPNIYTARWRNSKVIDSRWLFI